MEENEELFFGFDWDEDRQCFLKDGREYEPIFPGSYANPCVCTCGLDVYIGEERDPEELRGLWLIKDDSKIEEKHRTLVPLPASHAGKHHFRCALTG